MKKIFGFLFCAFLFVATLCSCSGKKTILIYATSEEERIAYIQEKLDEKFPEYNIVIQYSGTGALVSKLQGEGPGTDCDIIFELEANNMELLLDQNENFFTDLSDYDFTKFTKAATSYNHKLYAPSCMTYGAVVINKKVLSANGVAVPETYDDLLKPEYKGLIAMPNPKASGTGYLFYNGLVSKIGEEAALEYFSKLNANVKEYTSSGSAPIKMADRGEIGIGLAMLWQAVEYKKNNADLEYTFLDYGAPSNLYVMAIINGHEKKPEVKEVWDYIYNDLNKPQVEKFIPDPIYVGQKPEDAAYPTDVPAIEMNGLFDPDYKQNLLDKWSY
ncbi:MAG: extracellular solute-binding protein [Anaeroplasmataceae bacterium]|nr:extracellular solute-binding protein [Anaeroplasmataceae bacterium]MDE7385501.1 extracellular solute-binding protein [Anaeroplasmataceae bacterium]